MNIYDVIEKRVHSQRIKLRTSTNVVVRKNTDSQLHPERYPIILQRVGYEPILLEEHEAFVWELLNKGESIKNITIQYYFKYDVFALDYINQLIDLWLTKGVVVSQGRLFVRIEEEVNKKKFFNRVSSFMSYILSFGHLDYHFPKAGDKYTAFYKRFKRILTNKLFVQTLFVIALFGLIWQIFVSPHSLQLVLPGITPIISVLSLLLLNLIYIFIHESAHALALLRYNVKPERVGIRIFLGYPVFYVDSTSAWSQPRYSRMVITISGIVINFIFAGICCWILQLGGGIVWTWFLSQLIFINLSTVVINLIPFVETDGYYLLVDMLGEPNLKKHSLKVLEEIIIKHTIPHYYDLKKFVIFGILSVVTTAIFASMSVSFWVSVFSQVLVNT